MPRPEWKDVIFLTAVGTIMAVLLGWAAHHVGAQGFPALRFGEGSYMVENACAWPGHVVLVETQEKPDLSTNGKLPMFLKLSCVKVDAQKYDGAQVIVTGPWAVAKDPAKENDAK